MSKYSLQQIKSAYIQKKDWERQFPISYFLFRPISFYVTCLVLSVTNSPSKVAWCGFVIGLGGCTSLLFLSTLTIWPGLLLLIIYAVSDAVDGNIARVTRNVTYYGKYLDGVIGNIIEGSYFFCLGLGLYQTPGDSYFLNSLLVIERNNSIIIILASIIVSGRLFSIIVEGSYDVKTIQKQNDEGIFKENHLQATIATSSFRKNIWFLMYTNLNAFNLQLIILSLCAVLNIIDLFLLFFSAYYITRFFATLIFFTYRAQDRLS
ncbi:MAG: CDP-alcohol phosphatidyltransferase family protein [Thermodesulfobacteriota bacterium]